MAFGCHCLGDAKRGEGFAGAARHDELAPVGGGEAGDDILDGVFLVVFGLPADLQGEVLWAAGVKL